MSIYFNQTNITPGTTFSTGGGGGGSNFPDGINVGTSPTATLDIFGVVGVATLAALDSNGDPGPFQANALYAGNTPAGYASLLGDRLNFNTSNSGTAYTAIGFDGIDKMSLQNVASINGNAPVVSGGSNLQLIQYGTEALDGAGNASVLLPQAYKTQNSFIVLLTQDSTPPTAVPYVTNTSNNSFNITGDSNASMNWMSIGVL